MKREEVEFPLVEFWERAFCKLTLLTIRDLNTNSCELKVGQDVPRLCTI